LQANNPDLTNQNDTTEEEPQQVRPEVPSVSYLSTPRLARRQLINYSRSEDLLPLLSTFSEQSIEAGQGVGLGFDLARLEDALVVVLLGRGACPITLAIRHFHFAGEAQRTGLLTTLAGRIPQLPLPSSTLDTIWAEVDAEFRLSRLLTQLEDIIRFVGGMSPSAWGKSGKSGGGSGATRVEVFALQTLLLSPESWAELTTPTLSSSVTLAQLGALYTGLDERANGDPIDRTDPRYREEVPEGLLMELQVALGVTEFDGDVLRAAMHDLLAEQLVEPNFPADASLKQYLGFASQVDLDDEDWFVGGFPDGLELRHAFHAFKALPNN